MTQDRSADERISAWLLEEAPGQLPDRVFRATFERTLRTRQRRSFLGWGPLAIDRNAIVAVAAGAAAILLVALGAALLPRSEPPVGAGSFTDEFSTPLDDRWTFSGGTWAIVDGQLQGLGEADQLHVDSPSAYDLAGAVATARGVQATDVSVCADMTSLQRPDKGLVLRWRGPGDGIWLGFRGLESWVEGPVDSDLMVAEAVQGVPTVFTASQSLVIPPHDVGDRIHVCATLVGRRLVVDVDGHRVLDREFPVRVQAGAVGVHALAGNLAAYDNVRIAGSAGPDVPTESLP